MPLYLDLESAECDRCNTETSSLYDRNGFELCHGCDESMHALTQLGADLFREPELHA